MNGNDKWGGEGIMQLCSRGDHWSPANQKSYAYQYFLAYGRPMVASTDEMKTTDKPHFQRLPNHRKEYSDYV